MTCTLTDSINRYNESQGEATFKVTREAIDISGLPPKTIQRYLDLYNETVHHSTGTGPVRTAVRAAVLKAIPELIAKRLTYEPVTPAEAMLRTLMSPMEAHNLKNGAKAKSWTVRWLYDNFTNIAGGTRGLLAENAKPTASIEAARVRAEHTAPFQKEFVKLMMARLDADGPLGRVNIRSIYDETKYSDMLWREILGNLNRRSLGRTETWSKPETKAIADLVASTYDKMYKTLGDTGGVTEVLRNSPVRFHAQQLAEVVKQMGDDGVYEALRRAGTTDPRELQNQLRALKYPSDKSPTRMTILHKGPLQKVDLNYESNGASLLDAVDYDGFHGISKDLNTFAGNIGIRRSSGGIINDTEGFQEVLRMAHQELTENGATPKEIAQEIQVLTDMFDNLHGNPVRGGLAPEVRMAMNLMAVTSLGSAGIAQTAAMTLSLASKGAAVVTGRKGTALGHLIQNTFTGTQLAQEIEAVFHLAGGVRYVVPIIRQNELDMAVKYSFMRQLGIKTVAHLTLAHSQGTIGRALMEGSLMGVVSKTVGKFITTQTLNDVARYYKDVPTSMEHKRGVTAGFWTPKGKNPILDQLFRKMEYDQNGNLRSLNQHLWSPHEEAYLSQLMSQEVLRLTGERRTVGEFPSWMNPLFMHALLQFKDVGFKLTSSNMIAGLRYGDMDAVAEHAMAIAMSSILVLGKEQAQATIMGTSGAGNPNEFKSFIKYAFRMNEMGSFVHDTFNIYDILTDTKPGKSVGRSLIELPPIGALLSRAEEFAFSGDATKQIDAIQHMIPLNNVLLTDEYLRLLRKEFHIDSNVAKFKSEVAKSFTHWTSKHHA